jgi:hypothetical protein
LIFNWQHLLGDIASINMQPLMFVGCYKFAVVERSQAYLLEALQERHQLIDASRGNIDIRWQCM